MSLRPRSLAHPQPHLPFRKQSSCGKRQVFALVSHTKSALSCWPPVWLVLLTRQASYSSPPSSRRDIFRARCSVSMMLSRYQRVSSGARSAEVLAVRNHGFQSRERSDREDSWRGAQRRAAFFSSPLPLGRGVFVSTRSKRSGDLVGAGPGMQSLAAGGIQRSEAERSSCSSEARARLPVVHGSRSAGPQPAAPGVRV